MNKKKKEPAESFEASMERLEEIVAELEKGELPLEKSLERFEEALGIGSRCRQVLDRAELRVRKLIDVQEDGTLTGEDLSDDS